MIRISKQEGELICSRLVSLFDLVAFSQHTGQSIEDVEAYFKMSVAEAKRTLELLDGIELAANSNVLEVGAGLGIASSIMVGLGFSVTALEPGGQGFESNEANSQVLSHLSGSKFTVISEPAESVKFSRETQFDLIYSNNVLEHVTSFGQVVTNLLPYLSRNGIMIHSCPNYAFPYEPHFGKPLVPFFPPITKFLLPASIRNSGLWKSLNFVTYRDVRRSVRGTEYVVKFRRNTMTKSFGRLRSDLEFQKRHLLLGKIASNRLIYAAMKRVLSLPRFIATPMEFVIHHVSISERKDIQKWIDES